MVVQQNCIIIDTAPLGVINNNKKEHPEIIKHKNGFVSIKTPVTRAGIFLYEDDRYPNGIRRDYRPPEEVFDSASLETLTSVPVLKLHPDVGVVTSLNFKGVDYVGGTHPMLEYGAIKKNDSYITDGLLRASFTIYDAEAIDSLENGTLKSVSLGYLCDRDFTPGVINGHEYDCVQKNIRYNHLSLVPLGRMGITIDVNECVSDETIPENKYNIYSIDYNMATEKEPKPTETKSAGESVDAVTQLQTQLEATKDSLAKVIAEKNDLEKQLNTTSVDHLETNKTQLKKALKVLEYAENSGVDISVDAVIDDLDAAVCAVIKKVAPERDQYTADQGLIYLEALHDLGKQNLSNVLNDNTTNKITVDNNTINTTPDRYAKARESWLSK